jgi:enoyl-CoA hydratase/carnithine racemase
MAAEFDRACTLITQDDDIRVIVVAGFGDAFCAGGPTPQEALSASESLRVAASIAALEKPVIAALNGDAIGQGLEIALACDIRLAADGARMGMPQISEGGIPWDGGTQRLPRVVGRAWATDLLLTGRLVDADEALRIGLVHRVVALADLVAATTELAAAIAATPKKRCSRAWT